jgi:hypothetical protein
MCGFEKSFVVRVRNEQIRFDFETHNDFLEKCQRVMRVYMFEIESEVLDVCTRSCHTRILQWTDYDRMMLGDMNMRELSRKGMRAMMILSDGRHSAWCQLVSDIIVTCMQNSLRKTKGNSQHYCRPESECWCVRSILRTLQLSMLNYLFCPEYGVIRTVLDNAFVRIRDSDGTLACIPRKTWSRIWTSLLLSQVSRLGSGAAISSLNGDVMEMIHDVCLCH